MQLEVGTYCLGGAAKSRNLIQAKTNEVDQCAHLKPDISGDNSLFLQKHTFNDNA